MLHALEKLPLKRNEIAVQFEISPATLSNWRRQLKEEGRAQAKPHAGGTPTRFDAAVLRERIEEKNNR